MSVDNFFKNGRETEPSPKENLYAHYLSGLLGTSRNFTIYSNDFCFPYENGSNEGALKIKVNSWKRFFRPNTIFGNSGSLENQQINFAMAYLKGDIELSDSDLWDLVEIVTPRFLEENKDRLSEFLRANAYISFKLDKVTGPHEGIGEVPILGGLVRIILGPKNLAEEYATNSFYRVSGSMLKVYMNLKQKKHKWIGRALEKINIEQHYDLPEDLYHLFLGDVESKMQETAYSCPFAEVPVETDLTSPIYTPELENFVDETSLTQIQNWKFDLIARKLGLHKEVSSEEKKPKILDIGCGVGGLMAYLIENYADRIDSIVGVTLSERQKEVAERKLKELGFDKKAEVRIQNYQELDENEKFDVVASVGMMEHVGRENWGHYFQKIYDVSNDDAEVLIHSITTNKGEPEKKFEKSLRADDFIRYLVFPGGELPTSTEMVQAAVKKGFTIEHEHHFGIYYYFGLKKWYRNFCVNEAEIFQALKVHGFSEKRAKFTLNKFKLYLASCAQAFKTERCDLVQLVLNKSGKTRTNEKMSDYIKDID